MQKHWEAVSYKKHLELPVITQPRGNHVGVAFFLPKSVLEISFKKQNVVAHTFDIYVLGRKREHGSIYSTDGSFETVRCI